MSQGVCAFDGGDQCRALNEKNCDGCRFYKTEEMLKKSRAKAEKRLKTLSLEHQKMIKDSYHSVATQKY